MEIYYVLDASAFINGFKPTSKNNYTVPEITAEIKDFESRLVYDSAVDDGLLTVQDVTQDYIDKFLLKGIPLHNALQDYPLHE